MLSALLLQFADIPLVLGVERIELVLRKDFQALHTLVILGQHNDLYLHYIGIPILLGSPVIHMHSRRPAC